MKKTFKTLLVLLTAAVVMLQNISVFAAQTITIDKKTYIYTEVNGETKKEAKFYTSKGYAYCIQPDRVGAKEGTVLYFKERTSKGSLLYLLNKGNGKYSDFDYLSTQLAIWKSENNFVPKFFAQHENLDVVQRAYALAAEAANNKNFATAEPTLKIIGDATMTETSDAKYYKSGLLTVITNTSKASLTLVNAPSGTKMVDKNNNEITQLGNNQGFYVLVPASSISKETSFILRSAATGTLLYVDRYSPKDESKQDLVVLEKETKEVKVSVGFTVKPVKHVCEYLNGKYYGKNGNIVDQTTYSIECEKHSCEKVGNTYFGKNGNIVDQTTYSIECEKHSCEKVGNTYFGKNGNIVDQTTYSIECEKHTCEVVGNTYFGKSGNIVDKTTYSIECEKHSCEKVGSTYFGKQGNVVDLEQYDLECNEHICQKVGNTYFGKNGYEVDEVTYNKQCFTHTCEKVGNAYFGKYGLEVSYQDYVKECIPQEIVVPDTNSGNDLISMLIGTALLASVGIVILRSKVRA